MYVTFPQIHVDWFSGLTWIHTALLLAGCSSSSPQIPDIFLISLYYQRYKPTFNLAQVDPGVATAMGNVVGGAEMEVRVGFFGICIQPDGGSYICNSNATALAEVVTVDQDPLNLIWVASTFKDAVVFPYLLYVFYFSFPSVFYASRLTSKPGLLLSSWHSSALSYSSLSPGGTRKSTPAVPRRKSSRSHHDRSRSPRWLSSSLRPCSFSSPYYGNIQRPSQPVLWHKIWVTAASRAVLAHQPWYSVGSDSACLW